ncbi:helix-turn-helix domain-containing protein [Nocardia sp. CDC159]|uniref:Helix-turn-helix domain-containing protein n=1 Tax=Nocardia pulmonis TaxID=2951408 RepID=A0A9X2IZD8_9NOCA|nr:MULTISPECIES: helix-turn-helix transcriptional regulator [Nocardia]MCM6777967.1 helix-turn-helix domain-containing protein [Nocardia pulmonis]MCM6790862.1 helix-turn-helix domain-containing protein [Nocardia sp. CDC159]
MGNSVLARRRLGKSLRDGRVGLGLTLQQAGRSIRRSASVVQRLERGLAAQVGDGEIEGLCRVYEFDAEQTAEVLALAAESEEINWWSEYRELMSREVATYVGLEDAACRMTSYEGQLVPGLLQTPAYALTLVQTGHQSESPETHARRVALRMRRQACLTREDDPLILDVIIHESITRTWVGGTRVMSEQLERLAEMSTRPNITLRILPFVAGYPLGREDGPFVLLEFGADNRGRVIEAPLIYIENFVRELYLYEPEAIRYHRESFETLRRHSLDPDASRALLRQAAKDCANKGP